MIFFVMSHRPVEYSYISVEGEAEVTYSSSLSLLHEPVEQAVVEVSFVYRLHASATDGVQEQVVDVVGLQVFEAALEHRLAFFEVVLRGREVREFGGNEVVFSLVSAGFEGYTKTFFALAATVGRRCVEVVDAMIECELAQSINLFLVDYFATVLVLSVGQTHPAIAEEADFISLLRVGAVGHLVRGNGSFVMSHVVHLAVCAAAFYAARCQSRSRRSCSRDFQEVSSIDIFHSVVFYISLCTS